MFSRQKQLIKSIMQNHKGKPNPIPRDKLVSMVQFDDPPKDKDRVVRELLGELREEGLPVVNNGAGYYVCIKAEEFDSAIDRLESYQIALSKDIKALKEAKLKLYGEQQDLYEIGKKHLKEIRSHF